MHWLADYSVTFPLSFTKFLAFFVLGPAPILTIMGCMASVMSMPLEWNGRRYVYRRGPLPECLIFFVAFWWAIFGWSALSNAEPLGVPFGMESAVPTGCAQDKSTSPFKSEGN